MSKPVVICAVEHLRDGTEEYAKVCADVDAALVEAAKCLNGFGGKNTAIRLFELGKEIPIEIATDQKPQPPVETIICKLATT